jgi:hypothetical protein
VENTATTTETKTEIPTIAGPDASAIKQSETLPLVEPTGTTTETKTEIPTIAGPDASAIKQSETLPLVEPTGTTTETKTEIPTIAGPDASAIKQSETLPLVEPTGTTTETKTEIPTIREEYKDLVLSETQKNELDSVFKMKVKIEEPKSELVFEEYLKEYSTPLLGMVEKKTQETLANGDIEVTGNLNIFLVFMSTTENNINDKIMNDTISLLQKAVDDVFEKLFGYNGFPNKIKVNIFQVAYSTTIKLVTENTSLSSTTFKDIKHLSEVVELCHYTTKPKCPSTHHFMLIYEVSATKDTVFQHKVTHATVAASSDSNHYRKIVFSMAGAQFLCDLPNISIKDEDAAFVKATCSPNVEGNLPITHMDAAYLRRIWDIQNIVIQKELKTIQIYTEGNKT